MKILINGKWLDGFLDYCPLPGESIIRVLAWANLQPSDELYFIRPRSIKLIWNYFKEIGFFEVFKKIVSRTHEKFRNEKFISVGIGTIIKPGENSALIPEQLVGFFAPNFPACVERVSLPKDFIVQINSELFNFLSENVIFYLPCREMASVPSQRQQWWYDYMGWSAYAGQKITKSYQLDQKIRECIYSTNWIEGRRLKIKEASKFYFYKKVNNYLKKGEKSAVLFGYGNYAKTIIIPNIRGSIYLKKIHEVDPVQIPLNNKLKVSWSTCSEPCQKENFDVFFIAGFHHTHAPLAISAIEQGAYAVVEKPVVVDKDQLNDLFEVLKKKGERLFSCFHKRYLPMNDWAIDDLGVSRGDPISYHCIVYEVPLPRYHWYRWPNSKSRLVSNGCHWIDHFLFLNRFSAVKKNHLTIAADGTINCSLELANGAFFTMVLTDNGSERVGVRDYIELRAKGVTVKMIDGSLYRSENRDRIIRKKKINKMESYKLMYQSICKKILQDNHGDSIKSVMVSSETILTLEQILQEKLKTNSNDKL